MHHACSTRKLTRTGCPPVFRVPGRRFLSPRTTPHETKMSCRACATLRCHRRLCNNQHQTSKYCGQHHGLLYSNSTVSATTFLAAVSAVAPTTSIAFYLDKNQTTHQLPLISIQPSLRRSRRLILPRTLFPASNRGSERLGLRNKVAMVGGEMRCLSADTVSDSHTQRCGFLVHAVSSVRSHRQPDLGPSCVHWH